MSSSAVLHPNNADVPVSAPPVELVDAEGLIGELAGQWLYLPVNGAAFLLQAMHPVIGDVVGEYSSYSVDPYGRAVRSFDSVLRWVYGGAAALSEGDRLRRLHQPLQMRNTEGKHISALDSDAYAWVIATMFPSTIWAAPYVLGRELTDSEKDEVFADMHRIARIVQVPEGRIPADQEGFWSYYRNIVDNTLTNHPTAQNIVAGLIRKPPMPTSLSFAQGAPSLPVGVASALAPIWWPGQILVGRLAFLLTIGPMDPEIRDILGVRWTGFHQRQLELISGLIRLGGGVLPERLRYTPLAYHARAHQRALRQMRRRDLTSFVDQPHRSGCPF